jgi:hypothetical protein
MKGKVKIMAENKWTANDTQKQFMGALNKDNYLSLKQVNAKLGKEIKTGSINTLKVKGLVATKENAVEYKAEIVETRTYADGTVIVIKKEKEDKETGYKLV